MSVVGVPDLASRAWEHTPKRRCREEGGSSHPGLSDLEETHRVRAELQAAHGHINHLELVASDAETAWEYSHQSDLANQEMATLHVNRLAHQGLREQEVARETARRLEDTEAVADGMVLNARTILAQQAAELVEAARAGHTYAEARVRAERKFFRASR